MIMLIRKNIISKNGINLFLMIFIQERFIIKKKIKLVFHYYKSADFYANEKYILDNYFKKEDYILKN